jgi:hypothetical protein
MAKKQPAPPATAPVSPPVSSAETITVNPMFKGLLWINGGLCLVTLAIMVWAKSDATKEALAAREPLFNACEKVFTLTAGAFIGLLGGRAAAPDPRSSKP